MIPYDGFGYGQSSYWAYSAKELAQYNGEYCSCWNENEPRVQIKCKDGIDVKIRCVFSHVDSQKSFPKTEEQIKEKFGKFYDS